MNPTDDSTQVYLTAVILSYNSRRYLEHCLRSLQASIAAIGRPCEVRVVENGSRDGSADILRALAAEFPNIEPIFCDRNTGTTVSRNMALRQARGRYILVLDSDAEAPAATITHLADLMQADPRIGLAVPRLIYPDGRFQISTDCFPTLARKLARFTSLKRMEAQAGRDPGTAVREVEYAISAFWLLRREAVERTGLLDERIFYSPEDVDYCVRLWLDGWRIVYDPSVSAVHDAQEISRGKRLSKFTLRHAEGLAYYFAKYGTWLSAGALRRRIGAAR
ncbi:MAG: glycosyltransferase family 2 protein [Gammaproteobacteria bacterium]